MSDEEKEKIDYFFYYRNASPWNCRKDYDQLLSEIESVKQYWKFTKLDLLYYIYRGFFATASFVGLWTAY